ncbi:E3 ubiquitin-protein ligase RNF144A-like [Lineus longissimus]|uniref:E3 ubiquitin-protein ligase RNF144A-like n=1 Tax=Lineus longissimus TaxID=88925 RepID=UPI002B4F56B7
MAVYSASKNSVDLAIDPLITCRLCLAECALIDMYELIDCRCLYCRSCMTQYLTILISEGNIMSITCPDAHCKKQGQLEAAEIQRLIEPHIYEKYCRLKYQREVENDPCRTWCPEAGCETVCHVCPVPASSSGASGEAPPIISKPVHCPTCGLMFCSICKSKWHAGQTCDEHIHSGAADDHGGIPFNTNDDSEIKRCPLCHVPIERTDGCAQMMCKRCKHVFCWYCLASLDDDFLLRHYDKGPCKNKLGHSRASVIWHRTQVVGIFAGFGVLLLVASPFLLLAAPCILCCKCKWSKCCDDEDGDATTS